MQLRSLEEISGDISTKVHELLALFAELKQISGHGLRRCENENCNAVFETGPGAATKRRLYCSDRCRVAVHEAKRRLA